MVVGVCTVSFVIPRSMSLKEKRRVVRSAIARMRNRFNVAVAEVDWLDSRNAAVIGIVCVSNNANYARGILDRAVEWLMRERLDVQIDDVNIEVEVW